MTIVAATLQYLGKHLEIWPMWISEISRPYKKKSTYIEEQGEGSSTGDPSMFKLVGE